MSEFVKLTSAYGTVAFYINPLRIECFHARKDGGAYVCTSADDDQAYEVTETPEQIMALINGPADRDALVDALKKLMSVTAFLNKPETRKILDSVYDTLNKMEGRK